MDNACNLSEYYVQIEFNANGNTCFIITAAVRSEG